MYYKHYKGEVYRLLHIAFDTETGEDLVVYENNQGDTYTRSAVDFFGVTRRVWASDLVRRFFPIKTKEG
jgi:hypothetical protein